MPSERVQINARVEPEIVDGLKAVQERDGVPLSEQVRRALRRWLEDRGMLAPPVEPARKRVGARKRT